jgi:hypothetical protein
MPNIAVPADRLAAPASKPRSPPNNIEAEQALLGAILFNNEALDCVSGFLSPDHFYDPLHARIYETLATLIHAGKTATPVTVKTFFENAEPIDAHMTVPQYLGRLVANATTIINAAEYGRTIYNLATRRALIVIGEDAIAAAYDADIDRPVERLIENVEGRLASARGEEQDHRIKAQPYKLVAPEKIPPRQVMYGQEIRGLVGATVGRPGVGKTKLNIVELLAKATGRKLLSDTPTGKFRCWNWFGEEAQDDIDRLCTAAMNYYGITDADLGDRIFISSRLQRLIVATATREGLVIAGPAVKALKAFIRENRIDSVTIDPFVKSHTAPENDNGIIDRVVGAWAEIAHETKCSVNLYHHPRKTGGAPITVDDVRGGGAIVGAARSVRILNAMTTEEAKRANVSDAWSYVRVDDVKQNNLPPGEAKWFHLKSIPLAYGDTAGIPTPWEWPDQFAGINVSDLLAVQKAIDAGRYRENPQARDWVGKPIAAVLNLDLESEKKRIAAMVKTWVKNGVLVEVRGEDENRKKKTFIKVGEWATE